MVVIDQCVFGSRARKPTQLLATGEASVRLLRAPGHAGRCNHMCGHPPAIGLGRGGFRTTPLAAYPPGLCAALASACAATWDGARHAAG
eukprot:990742-Lingulodinium_polyedra.AAC.1